MSFTRRRFLAASASASTLLSTLVACQNSAPRTDDKSRFEAMTSGLPTAKASRALNFKASVVDPVSGRSAYQLGTAQNPTLVWQRGDRITGNLVNALPQPTSIHWHGLQVPAAMDGSGLNPVAPGASSAFDFTVLNRGGLYWYHAHPHYLTAEQVYQGLAGLIVIQDEDDRALSAALNTRLDEHDLALKLQDATMLAGQWLPFRTRDKQAEAVRFGTHVEVNGIVSPTYQTSAGWVRLRLLNASAARGMLIELHSDAGEPQPLHLLGTDGGLLVAPIECKSLFIYPGERLDVAVRLSARDSTTARSWSVMSAVFDARRFASMSATAMVALHAQREQYPALGGDSLCMSEPPTGVTDGQALPLFTLMTRPGPERLGALPRILSVLPSLATTSQEAAPDRSFVLTMNSSAQWLINDVANGLDLPPLNIRRGAQEVWEIQNSPISVPHPMHLHGFNFRVLSRRGLYGPARQLVVDGASRLATDIGLKDTVTVWPGERVRLLIDFSHGFDGLQRFLLHCHNLDHEDAMMMVPINVSA